jgi:hypothetical protein
VELLRARHLVVESDGQGTLRAFLPARPESEVAGSVAAAQAAWQDAWPVLRHVLAAERRRRPGKLSIEVYPYVHDLARTRFRVGVTAWRTEVDETEKGDRAPLDLDAWARFLERGLQLEGARLTGRVRPWAARVCLRRSSGVRWGSPIWRSRGGRWRTANGRPYMSTDRGASRGRRRSAGGRLSAAALAW